MRSLSFHDPSKHGRFAAGEAMSIASASGIPVHRLGDSDGRARFEMEFYHRVTPAGVVASRRRPYSGPRLGQITGSHPGLVLPASRLSRPENAHSMCGDLAVRLLYALARTIVGGTEPFLSDLSSRMRYLGGDLLRGNDGVPLPPPWSVRADPMHFYVDYWGASNGNLKMIYWRANDGACKKVTAVEHVDSGAAAGANMREMARRWKLHFAD